jgi:tetratricopeptide (TPR) repeat protein
MKKSFILGLAALAITSSVYAQKGALNTAKSEYDTYAAIKGTELGKKSTALTTAKENIDKAALHEKTSGNPQTWAYKSMIYADLANKAKGEEATANLNEAVAAFKKAKELDATGAEKESISKAANLLVQYRFVKGKAALDKQKYKDAYLEFNNALDYAPGDTTLNYAAGIAALYAKDYKNGIARFNELLSTNYSALPTIYENIAYMQIHSNDTTAALQSLAEGVKKFPSSNVLATREIEYNLMAGKEKEMISKISSQLEKNPTNKLYAYYLGLAYGTAKETAKAEEAYQKALAIDPNYVDANINIGVLILNNGIDLYNKANRIPESKVAEYNVAKKKAIAEFDRAYPFLQKAADLNPKSNIALTSLKRYYTVKGDNDKVKEVEAKLNAL